MKFADEFRDAGLARALGARIAAEAGDKHWKIMEVCGGHTHTIFKYGIEDLLPGNVELVHGPGCPVCVIPMGRLDDGIALARDNDVIFACFGDLMRVPGSDGEVLKGVLKPWECTVFGTACTPETPIGTCMVSSEGACAAYYNFGRYSRARERERVFAEGGAGAASLTPIAVQAG